MKKNKPSSQKIRVDFRKNRAVRTRQTDLTRQYDEHAFTEESAPLEERMSGKGDLARHRTIIAAIQDDQETGHQGFNIQPHVETSNMLRGRVIRVHGVDSTVQAEDGQQYRCVTRRILKTLATDQRQPVVAGDRVLFRSEKKAGVLEGMIERIEPRFGTLARESRHRKHVIVTNVDQVLIVTSVDQPAFKPHFIDRMLLSAEQSGIRPIICINKMDLRPAADLQPIIGNYAQMGYEVMMLSATTGLGLERLRHCLQNQESVVVGQSGVGKSSLLNAIEPDFQLRVAEIGHAQKGKHTTTTAELLELSFGGYVVDTPGMRQLMLWDIIPEEIFGYFRDLRPYENLCFFPDCTHSHEDDCAVKNAVAEGRLDLRRYESYLAMRFGK